MSNILKLVLTDYWFEEIKSGHKTHEYRMATIFKEKVQTHYKSLMEEKSPDVLDKRTQFERLLSSAKSNLMWSEYLDKLPNNKYSLGGGWLYEHEVFSILYLMRIFNPKKQTLIFLGY